MAVLLGQTGVGADSANSNAASQAFSTQLTCLISGTVTSVWLRCGTTIPTAGNTRWAIYSSPAATPVTRLTADNSGTAGTVGTYSSFPIDPGLPVEAGTKYYIAFVSESGVFQYTDFATSGGDSSDDTTSTLLPVTWVEAAAFANIINMRAEGPATAETAQGRGEQIGSHIGPF